LRLFLSDASDILSFLLLRVNNISTTFNKNFGNFQIFWGCYFNISIITLN